MPTPMSLKNTLTLAVFFPLSMYAGVQAIQIMGGFAFGPVAPYNNDSLIDLVKAICYMVSALSAAKVVEIAVQNINSERQQMAPQPG